jgi:hypothetical protein
MCKLGNSDSDFISILWGYQTFVVSSVPDPHLVPSYSFEYYVTKFIIEIQTGAYILENTPSPWGREKYQPMSFWGKNMKRLKEKGGKCKRKRKKG